MGLPLSKRDDDIFLSHAHADRAFVSGLDEWLSRKAGFSVWYDDRELSAGAALAIDLQAAIQRCRATVLVATHHSLDRGWVQAEYNAAMDERANHPGFRVVALRLGEADVSSLMRGVTLDRRVRGRSRPGDGAEPRACVLSRGEASQSREGPGRLHKLLVAFGRFRERQGRVPPSREAGVPAHRGRERPKGFGAGDRVERIMASCGAFLGILPFREARWRRSGSCTEWCGLIGRRVINAEL